MKKELHIKLTPKASANRIIEESEKDGISNLKVYVTVVPEEGKANAAMIEILAKHYDLPKSAFTLIRGHKSRSKVVIIT